MTTLTDLKKEIELLKARNKRVEANKAWETSFTRKVIIAVLTYIIVLSFFLINKLPNPFVNSLVPSLAYMLSTLSLSFFKTKWLEQHAKRRN